MPAVNPDAAEMATPPAEPGRIVVLAAPSGSGKTTIAHALLQHVPGLHFSVSVTTRPARLREKNGVDYYFVTGPQFRELIEKKALVEYEEVYPGRFYGTLREEMDRATSDSPVLLDIDVRGALNLKKMYGEEALTIFIRPPSLEVLAERLSNRGTEDEQSLKERLELARREIEFEKAFDIVIINDRLEDAVSETLRHVNTFLGR
jgi:guanylate kinase